jgi:hypothetical protein
MISDSERKTFLKCCKQLGKTEDDQIAELIRQFIDSRRLP